MECLSTMRTGPSTKTQHHFMDVSSFCHPCLHPALSAPFVGQLKQLQGLTSLIWWRSTQSSSSSPEHGASGPGLFQRSLREVDCPERIGAPRLEPSVNFPHSPSLFEGCTQVAELYKVPGPVRSALLRELLTNRGQDCVLPRLVDFVCAAIEFSRWLGLEANQLILRQRMCWLLSVSHCWFDRGTCAAWPAHSNLTAASVPLSYCVCWILN